MKLLWALPLFFTCICWSPVTHAQPKTRKPAVKAETAPVTDGSESLKDSLNDSERSSVTAAEKPPKKRSSRFFPDWRPDSFDWRFGPILASQAAIYEREGITYRSTAFEIGAHVGVSGVPLVLGNPGITLQTGIGYAVGAQTAKKSGDGLTDAETKEQSATTKRAFGDLSLRFYKGFYRHTLQLGRGRLDYHGKDSDTDWQPVQSALIGNDFGILILPWLSEHLTWKYTKAFANKFSRPFLAENDLWLHTRMQADFLDLVVDLGPGMTLSDEYSDESMPEEKLATGRSDYLQLLSSANFFWKLGASLATKYVYHATEERLGTYVERRLPDQELGQPRRLTPPEDSVLMNAFVGLRQIFYGLGLGYHYDLQIYRLGGNDSGPETRVVEQGFGLSYEANF